jgi:20S proteasome alpha/beta subunit
MNTKHLPLPTKYVTPYIRADRPKAKPMTIALGVQAPDGIILCSDSQLTVPQYMKYSDSKIRTIENGAEWSVALTYSGDPERMNRIYESMRRSLLIEPEQETINADYVRKCFEEALAVVRQSIIHSYENIDVLCAFARKTTREEEFGLAGSGLRLFSGKNGVVVKPNSEFSILGAGDSSLTRYLENLLSSFGQSYMEYRTALVIGAYIVEQAKKYVDMCGGDLQVCILRSGHKPLSQLNPEIVNQLTEIGTSLETILQKIIVCSLGVEMEAINYEKGETWEGSLIKAVSTLRSDLWKLDLRLS